MTREELRDYVDEQRSLGNIPYHVYSTLINGLDTLEQEPTTKNDLGVDCVARQDIERYIEGFINEYTPKEELEFINLELDGLKHLPPATPQEPILDKIRAEIDEYGSIMVSYAITKDTKTDKGIEKLVSGVLKQAKEQVLEIIDKYKAEVEPQESEE